MRLAIARVLLLLSLCACSRSIVRGVDGALPDAATPDARTPDAGSFDAGTPEMDIDPVGRWHDCTSSMIINADGSLERVNLQERCSSYGRWEVEGRLLTTVIDRSDCGTVGEPVVTRSVVTLAPGGMVRVNPDTGQVSRMADDDAPRTFYVIEGTNRELMLTGLSEARVVGNPEDRFGSGCYWSADGECGGLFSCNGTIAIWDLRPDGTFSGRTDCSGGCPCGAVQVGRVLDDGVIEGTYNAANCSMVSTGEFTARPTVER